MPDETSTEVGSHEPGDSVEKEDRSQRVAEIQKAARKGPAISPERFREIYGGQISKNLATAEAELARIEEAIVADNNPRTNNHATARRRVENLKQQLETLVQKHNERH